MGAPAQPWAHRVRAQASCLALPNFFPFAAHDAVLSRPHLRANVRLQSSDVGDGTWGGTNPAMPWDWKGGKIDSGVYDNVLPDADAHTWKPATIPTDPNAYQKEWLGSVINIY